MRKIRIGTRKSPLAVWQAEYIGKLLKKHGLDYELIKIETKGDKILDQSLHKIGSKGVFTEELEILLQNGEIDIAQHSAKDLTSNLPGNLPIIAFTKREIANDVLISTDSSIRLNSLDKKIIGTSSTRRQAILKEYFPQHSLVEMRGNLQTRMEKLNRGDADAIILAYAGVHRMGLEEYIVETLDLSQFTPAVGQGSVAIQASDKLNPDLKIQIQQILNDAETQICIEAEREILKNIQGGCSIPFYGHCQNTENGYLFRAGIIDAFSNEKIQLEMTGDSPMKLAKELSNDLINRGIHRIIKNIKSKL